MDKLVDKYDRKSSTEVKPMRTSEAAEGPLHATAAAR